MKTHEQITGEWPIAPSSTSSSLCINCCCCGSASTLRQLSEQYLTRLHPLQLIPFFTFCCSSWLLDWWWKEVPQVRQQLKPSWQSLLFFSRAEMTPGWVSRVDCSGRAFSRPSDASRSIFFTQGCSGADTMRMIGMTGGCGGAFEAIAAVEKDSQVKTGMMCVEFRY